MSIRALALTIAMVAARATPSLAQIIVDPPDPNGHSTLGINLPATVIREYIVLEGRNLLGAPDPCSDGRCGDFTVEIRDFANNLIANSDVWIDFTECVAAAGGEFQIACDQSSGNPGQTLAAPNVVGGTTNAAGRFTFRVIGSARSNTIDLPGTDQTPGKEMGAAQPCAKVYADGVLLGRLRPVAYDINGTGSPSAAVNSADVATVLAEVVRGGLTGIRYARTDLNRNGVVNAADAATAAMMSTDATLGSGSNATGPYCP